MDQHKHNMLMGMLKTRMEHKPESEELAEIHDRRVEVLQEAMNNESTALDEVFGRLVAPF